MPHPEIVTDFLVTRGGLLHHGLRRLGFKLPLPSATALAALVLALAAWLPLLVLSIIESTRIGPLEAPFLSDFSVALRLLVALPLLIVADAVVEPRLSITVRYFLDADLVATQEKPRFAACIQRALHLRDSPWPQGIILLIAVGLTFAGFTNPVRTDISSWHSVVGSAGPERTLAGLFFDFLCMPLYRYVELTWVWRYIVWINFLWGTSRLKLRIVPSHPDLAGGLAFVGLGQMTLNVLVVAYSISMAGVVGMRVVNGAPLATFYPLLGAFVALTLVAFLGPLLMYTPKLLQAKRSGLLRYGALAERYTAAFESRWMEQGASAREDLLGSADIQSLADLSNSFGVVRQMRPIPFGTQTVVALVGAAVVPLLPLLLLKYPIKEILSDLIRIVL